MSSRAHWFVSRVFAGLLCLAVCGWAQAPQHRRLAYVIANGTYQNLAAIQSATADAELVHRALESAGFSVTVAKDLTGAQIRTLVGQMGRDAKAGDTVLMYYVGHAVTRSDESWMIGADFNPALADQLDDHAFSLKRPKQDLVDFNDDNRVGALFLILDTAYAEPKLQRVAQTEGLLALPFDESTSITYSTLPGKSQPLPTSAKTSAFANAFAKSLETKGQRMSTIFRDELPKILKASAPGRAATQTDTRMIADLVLRQPDGPKVVPLKTGDAHDNPKEKRITYIYIEPGTFQMGCVPSDRDCHQDENPARTVKLTHGFWIANQETPVGAYRAFTEATGGRMPDKNTRTNPGWRDTTQPISEITWPQAQSYCKWAGGRLPTEAEWEYAARDGETGHIYPWGDALTHENANFVGTDKKTRDLYDEGPAPAMTFKESKWHLYDMVGNVAEWVADYYAPTYDVQNTDPKGPATGDKRVVRGGSYTATKEQSRISSRKALDETPGANYVGFRCVVDRW